jgi:uncharacterized repeat protein (TIGR03803 family)
MKSEFPGPTTNRISTVLLSAKKTRKQRYPWTLVLAGLLGLAAVPPSAHGQTFTTLYSFKGGTDGATPAGITRDAAGNLYGATVYGGDLSCSDKLGCGTVFKLSANGNEAVLHRFGAQGDGQFPVAGVIRDAAGNLYGATGNGGGVLFCGDGCGTVFKLNAAGKETALHALSGRMAGGDPGAGVIRDAAGNLYGTTEFGGAFNAGAVFKLDNTGKETVLYSFTGGADGFLPNGLIRDAAGNLYGTTAQGGNLTSCGYSSGCGTVFKLDPTGKETVLYRFSDGVDGGHPFSGVVRDAAGNLYGTTDDGGALFFYGTAFKLDTTGNYTVLHDFTGGSDGGYPTGTLILDASGNLYGTTSIGGAALNGTLFELDTTGKETVLYNFADGADGGSPNSIVLDAVGNLYGTTMEGGDPTCFCGTVFKVVP